MTDIAPRQDLATLAVDVDRLFRARQGHRSAPLGKGYQSSQGYAWKAAPEEAYAHHVLKAVNGEAVADLQAPVVERDSPAYLRTRAHVCMLGLTNAGFVAERLLERDTKRRKLHAFFVERVGKIASMLPTVRGREIDGLDAYMVCHRMLPDDRVTSRAFVDRGVIEAACGRVVAEFPPEPGPKKSDVARTHRYLVDLDRRLREWRETEARREAVATADAQAAARDRKAEDEAAYRADEMAAAEDEGDLACFE